MIQLLGDRVIVYNIYLEPLGLKALMVIFIIKDILHSFEKYLKITKIIEAKLNCTLL